MASIVSMESERINCVSGRRRIAATWRGRLEGRRARQDDFRCRLKRAMGAADSLLSLRPGDLWRYSFVYLPGLDHLLVMERWRELSCRIHEGDEEGEAYHGPAMLLLLPVESGKHRRAGELRLQNPPLEHRMRKVRIEIFWSVAFPKGDLQGLGFSVVRRPLRRDVRHSSVARAEVRIRDGHAKPARRRPGPPFAACATSCNAARSSGPATPRWIPSPNRLVCVRMVVTVRDAHTHFFSRVYFETLGAQAPGERPAGKLEEVARRAGIELPGADSDVHLQRWLSQLDAAGVASAVGTWTVKLGLS